MLPFVRGLVFLDTEETGRWQPDQSAAVPLVSEPPDLYHFQCEQDEAVRLIQSAHPEREIILNVTTLMTEFHVYNDFWEAGNSK